ncbi:hypothetical protein CAEBREN_19172 [Caenorhabditis brenneri]|uniref:RING-type domain-containing protein n=1 Tax=Caenorhabditis brenneri TaxID=135651 RepID=G0PAY5_CAEBE|nr:hypothetical protein CAEBREN_19172 [Caenorhabditis brenneri]
MPQPPSSNFAMNKYFMVFLQTINFFFTGYFLYYSFKTVRVTNWNYVIVCSIAIFVTFVLLCIRKWKISSMEVPGKRDRKLLKTGYGMLALCGIIPQFLVLPYKGNPMILLCTATICNLLPYILLPMFVLKHSYTGRHPKSCIKTFTLALHYLTAGITTIFGFGRNITKEEFDMMKSIIWFFTIFFSCYSAEFISMMIDGIWLEGEEEEEEEDLEIGSTNPKCNVCTQEFSSQIIPRFLVGCGHTICHGCAETLLKLDREYILCPFCREQTNVPGGVVEVLPKNFAILEMIH